MAASNYYLLEYGSGMKMLENAVVLQNDGLLDVEALERYILEELDGVVDQKYADIVENITYTEGEKHTSEEDNDKTENPDTTGDDGDPTEKPDRALLIVCIAFGVVLILIVIFFVAKKVYFVKRNP